MTDISESGIEAAAKPVEAEVRNEIARILAAIRAGGPNTDAGDKEDIITYAKEVVSLRHPPASREEGLRVKALEWEQNANGGWEAASSLGLNYIIQVPYRGSSHSVWLNLPGAPAMQFPNCGLNDVGDAYLDAPKSAAQEHYTNAILSAIETESKKPE